MAYEIMHAYSPAQGQAALTFVIRRTDDLDAARREIIAIDLGDDPAARAWVQTSTGTVVLQRA